jgi:hypothetical protein
VVNQKLDYAHEVVKVRNEQLSGEPPALHTHLHEVVKVRNEQLSGEPNALHTHLHARAQTNSCTNRHLDKQTRA